MVKKRRHPGNTYRFEAEFRDDVTGNLVEMTNVKYEVYRGNPATGTIVASGSATMDGTGEYHVYYQVPLDSALTFYTMRIYGDTQADARRKQVLIPYYLEFPSD